MTKGTPPPAADGWTEDAVLVEPDGLEWQLFGRLNPADTRWRNFKLVAVGRAKHKANFWFGMHVVSGRVALARDLTTLREHRPALHAAVLQVLSRQVEPLPL
jgi:hypothetical protein